MKPYYETDLGKLYHGDCLQILPMLEPVDLVLTDPPYEIGFMGKSWDSTGIANNVEVWKQALRVLKPGGHLMAFGGCRTYHRTACAIEDAGFEIRDMIEWVYGSGFPKSLNIGKSVNQLETNEWSKIGKALDNIDQKSIMEIWKSNSSNVKIVETQSLKNQIIAGQDTPSENFVVLNVAQNSNQENSNLLVSFAEQNLNEAQAINIKTNTALLSVETEIRQLQNNVKSAEQQPQNQNHKSWNIFTAQCDVKEWLNENTMVNHKVDEALKTLRGNRKYSNEEITSVLCAVLPSVLKLTILNQSKTFQNLDTNQKMDYASAINVIITEYTAENLISNTVAILKSKVVDELQGNEREVVESEKKPSGLHRGKIADYSPKNSDDFMPTLTKGTSEWEGWGTALKPAHEPICMARKPLEKGLFVAENCLKWGTGGIDVDGSRVEMNGEKVSCVQGQSKNQQAGEMYSGKDQRDKKQFENNPQGRFPANLIHDNSEEVRACFPETKSGGGNKANKKPLERQSQVFETVDSSEWNANSGNASRFFKSIIYIPKASKAERNRGCEGLELCQQDEGRKEGNPGGDNPRNRGLSKRTNHHPTVKPIALMEYLINMTTKEGQAVLDLFLGSGTTAIACERLNRRWIGIEIEEKYCEIAAKRIENERKQRKLF